MQKWMIGKEIRELREQKRITLSQLGRGFCSAKEVSRLERGEKEADLELLEVLLQRLGESLEHYDVYVGDEEFFKYHNRQRIEKLMDQEAYGELKKEIEEWKETGSCTGKIMEQIFYLAEAELFYQEKKWEEVRRSLKKAMELTNLRLEGEVCYTTIELRILMRWVHISKGIEKEELCEKICTYIERGNLYGAEIIKIYPPFLLEVSKGIAQENKEEAIRCCKRGITYLQENMSLWYLAELFYQKLRLGEGTYVECVQTYGLFWAMGRLDKAMELRNYVKEEYGWQFTESEMLSIIIEKEKE